MAGATPFGASRIVVGSPTVTRSAFGASPFFPDAEPPQAKVTSTQTVTTSAMTRPTSIHDLVAGAYPPTPMVRQKSMRAATALSPVVGGAFPTRATAAPVAVYTVVSSPVAARVRARDPVVLPVSSVQASFMAYSSGWSPTSLPLRAFAASPEHSPSSSSHNRENASAFSSGAWSPYGYYGSSL